MTEYHPQTDPAYQSEVEAINTNKEFMENEQAVHRDSKPAYSQGQKTPKEMKSEAVVKQMVGGLMLGAGVVAGGLAAHAEYKAVEAHNETQVPTVQYDNQPQYVAYNNEEEIRQKHIRNAELPIVIGMLASGSIMALHGKAQEKSADEKMKSQQSGTDILDYPDVR